MGYIMRSIVPFVLAVVACPVYQPSTLASTDTDTSSNKGHGKCRCIDSISLGEVLPDINNPDYVKFTNPTTNITAVPINYGTSCAAWDSMKGQEYYIECVPPVGGTMVVSANGQTVPWTPPEWCNTPWCYVDMCNCAEVRLIMKWGRRYILVRILRWVLLTRI